MLDFIGHESYDYSKDSRDGHAGWDTLVDYDREIIKDGYIQLSDKPGLGLDLNKDVAMKSLVEGEKWWGQMKRHFRLCTKLLDNLEDKLTLTKG